LILIKIILIEIFGINILQWLKKPKKESFKLKEILFRLLMS